VTPHKLYSQLGQDEARRRAAYRALFENGIGTETLTTIREATNGDWAIGNERFRNEIEALLQRRAGPGSRGGDRKSAAFRGKNQINRV
jgi:putative transposase